MSAPSIPPPIEAAPVRVHDRKSGGTANRRAVVAQGIHPSRERPAVLVESFFAEDIAVLDERFEAAKSP